MDNEHRDNWSFIDIISILSFIVGLQNLELNEKQIDGLMSEMTNNQDSMLTTIIKQNKQIIAQNEEIIKLLKENK